MPVQRKTKPPTSVGESLGLLAVGSSGPWSVAIDETTKGKERWFAQLEGPSLYLYFEIPSLAVVDEAIAFLTDTRTGTLSLGARKSPVHLVSDDEFPDRYFLVIGQQATQQVRLTVTESDLKHIVNALRQAKEDIET